MSSKTFSRQSSAVSDGGKDGSTIAVGIDLGSYNARIGMYDEKVQHPVSVANHDGHRTTCVTLKEEEQQEEGSSNNKNNTTSPYQTFFQSLMDLASDAAHTKDLHVVVSVPNTSTGGNIQHDEWIQNILLKDSTSFNAKIITEAAAVCLAYEEDADDDEDNNNEDDNNNDDDPPSAARRKGQTLVVDGGNRGIKATVLSQTSTGLWKLDMQEQILDSVNATLLLEPLAKYVAQQFELKHRFPKGEVWESKKARTKLYQACQIGLKTLYINKTSAPIHVDGLYEGIDYQISVSKPKWEHLSGKLVRETKGFLSKFGEVDRVLLSGGLYTWLTPICMNIFGSKLQPSTSYFDPSESIAMGCTKQAYLNIESSSATASPTTTTLATTTIDVPISPVSIGIVINNNENGSDDKDVTSSSSSSKILIEKGTPLPAMVVTQPLSSSTSTPSSFEIWQKEPISKALCRVEELDNGNDSVLKLQMTETGTLRVWVDGETLAF